MNKVILKVKGMTSFLPNWLRNIFKYLYRKLWHINNRVRYIKKGRHAYVSEGCRFDREKPYYASVGAGTHVEEFNIWNANAGNIIIGENCLLGLHNIIMGPIEIGDNVSTGPRVAIVGPRHALQGKTEGTTIIGKNVWISTGSIIHFGVKIGDNAVIGPGSVVTKDVPENAYVAGNPARNITELSNLKGFMHARGKETT